LIGGIGTDIVAIERIGRIWSRHGERLCRHILSPAEREEMGAVHDVPRWLAKRWAVKEAFGKAAGTGMRAPIKWTGLTVVHDAHGRPDLAFAPFIQAWLHRRGIDRCHVSLSDERDLVCAFVVLEHLTSPRDVA
jgi:holo-[acyl-carrier protein] synthase